MSDNHQRLTSQVFGLALLTAFSVIYVFITLVFLTPSDALAASAFTVVTGGATYLVWRLDRAWAILVGLLVTLAVAAVAFYTVFGVFQVFSPLEFVTSLLLILGLGFGLVGGVGALLSRLRERERNNISLRLRNATLGLIGVASVISIVGFLVTRDGVAATEAAGATVIDMEQFLFVPENVTVAPGEQLLVTNSDGFAHDFTLDVADIYVHYVPGSQSLVNVSDLEPGAYEFFCSLHTFDGEGMTGTLTIDG